MKILKVGFYIGPLKFIDKLYICHAPRNPETRRSLHRTGFFITLLKQKPPVIMKQFIKWLLTPVIFKQFSNGKFLKIEIQFIAWCVALCPAVFRSGTTVPMGFPDSFTDYLWTFISLIPFLFMVFIVIRAKYYPHIFQLTDIPKEWWISRLSLSHYWWFTKTAQDLVIQQQLSERFLNTFGVEFKNGKYHWTYYLQLLILFVPTIICFYLGVNI